MAIVYLAAASVSSVFALGFLLSRARGALARTVTMLLGCAAADFWLGAWSYGAASPAAMEPKPWLGLMALYGVLIARLYGILGDLEERRGLVRFLPWAILLPAIVSDFLVHGLSLLPAKGAPWDLLIPGLHAATGIGVLACCLLPAILVFRFHSPKRMEPASWAVLGVSCVGTLALAAGLAGLVSGKGVFFMAMDCFKALAILAGALLYFRWPDALGDFRKTTAKGRYRVSSLGGMDAEGLLSGMEERIRRTGWFLDPECSLEGLAALMGMTRNQVSELLNARLGLGFAAYVNGFRIERARELLASRPDLAVLSIACEVGFGNKASFNESFLRETGMTPREYRSETRNKSGKILPDDEGAKGR